MKLWLKISIFCGILLLTLSADLALFSRTNLVNKFTCTYQGKPLYGRVKFVESFQDIKVKVVTTSPDLRVKMVTNSTTRCGEWAIVEFLPNLKVQFVETLPDIEIQFVEDNPGV
ncbi:hypothetical protein MiSe_89990 [Microseira wollei NIES-4236]|uniref:7(1) septoil knot domain-containing protein n=2 Tax=Microseira wollei TaxID=467598 RepID=A0AAV3XR03_9CYAN|nr:hypothetical protein MiSe_89990 [Microseira wollei NIES-4236]